MGIELSGFDAFETRLRNASGRMEASIDKACARTAEQVRSITVKGLRDQSFSLAPLSAKYAAIKEKLGGGNKVLISGVRRSKSATPRQLYLLSFSTMKVGTCEYLVGSNYPQARALENGYAENNLPARPHLAPAVKEAEPIFHEELLRGVKEAFDDI